MEKAITELIKKAAKNREEFNKNKRIIAKKYKKNIIKNSEILKIYKSLVEKRKIKENKKVEGFLKKRAIRTISGIAPIAVLTKPYFCPGRCAYCPDEKGVPKSYLSNEPAVMRAIRSKYNPYEQVQFRIKALEDNGHDPTKIELIVIGGTWSFFDKKYKYWYIINCFKAANDYKKRKDLAKYLNDYKKIKKGLKITELKTLLLKEQKRNEKAKYKIVGLTLETRPDFINKKELVEMRELGATRVEIGVQAVDDEILEINKRGHGIKEVAVATQLLRDFGFKVTYHFMPGLPGSNINKDLKMFKELFSDERFQPDQIKIYPTVVTKGSLLYKWWRAGKYKPYSDSELQELIIKCKKIIPPYVRVIRLIRDIPGESIEAGNKITNLRQIMKDKGLECKCIRCREAKDKKINKKDLFLKNIKYSASGGEEEFVSYESKSRDVLYGFVRLRLKDNVKKDNILIRKEKTALIRELHVYGELVSEGDKKIKVQHRGLGKKLMEEAEKISKKKGFEYVVVISGVGVRGYYRKMGYKLEKTYMIKKI
ncbi:tRNA uridine(34) 5-carboxymethylaminomethyl modification radical SAM/GNAT enzyme Elp3 [bacterium]|nr:tRNA uridine(34) 5-carboxymethylaminomethyl modification radical SAM/GNAT enzyme Elp3 [bacterium]